MEKNCENELPLHIHDENNGLDYTLHGDYYLPDGQPIAKYGRARLRYLQEHRSIIFNRLLLSGKLYDDLHRADEEAEGLLDTMLAQMAKDAGVIEMPKASDPMKWFGMMNAISR